MESVLLLLMRRSRRLLLAVPLGSFAQADGLVHELKETGLLLRPQVVVCRSIRSGGSVLLLDLVIVVLLMVATSRRPLVVALVLVRSWPVGLAIGCPFIR